MIKDLIKVPYDTEKVKNAIEEEKELDGLRSRIYEVIKDSYDEAADTENAERVADACLEKGIRLIGGRFSRAFYIDAMLLASSKVIDGRYLKPYAAELEKSVRGMSMNFRNKDLRECGIDFGYLLPEVQKVVNLASRDRVSAAENSSYNDG